MHGGFRPVLITDDSTHPTVTAEHRLCPLSRVPFAANTQLLPVVPRRRAMCIVLSHPCPLPSIHNPQVCILCEADIRRNWEQENGRPHHSLRHDKNGARSHSDTAVDAGAGRHLNGDVDGQAGPSWDRRQATTQGVVNANGGDWLSCLRRLYAAVPPDSLSTVELVLEQTLHQMPDVAESLLDAIQRRTGGDSAVGTAIGDRRRSSRGIDPKNDGIPWTASGTPRKRSGNEHGIGSRTAGSNSGTGSAAEDLITNDLGLLLLLLREAAPLRACSLPLLPDGADRGRRAEEGVHSLLLSAARRGFDGGWCADNSAFPHSTGSGNGSGSCGGGGGGCILGVEELAAETIWVVFDAVPGARPRLLRSLLSGVLDGSHGGAACTRSYLLAWERLMAQEGRLQVGIVCSIPVKSYG